ncbi:MAG: hypothetical protein K2K49_00760 [Duncaniella sp.]|nr:hypothetical protein [Duncaniella sp.]
MAYQLTHSTDFTLTASDVTPALEMPLSRLVTLVIDTATDHANLLGIGFATLRPHNASWILGRLAVDIREMPTVGGTYALTTWIESASRLASDRSFRLTDMKTGRTMATIHTVWMAIDLTTRRPVDLLGVIGHFKELVSPADPEICRCCGLTLPKDTEVERSYEYTYRVSDIDVNRHVTTRRYIDMIVDLLPLETLLSHRISRFDIAFKNEACYGQTADVLLYSDGLAAIQLDSGKTAAIARIELEARS